MAGVVELIVGAISAIIVIFLGLIILPALANATGQSPVFGISVMLLLLGGIIIGVIVAIIKGV